MVRDCWLHPSFIWSLPFFPPTSFWSGIQPHVPHGICLFVPLVSSGLWRFLSLPLSFMTLAVLKSTHLRRFVRSPLVCIGPIYFCCAQTGVMGSLWLWVFGKNTMGAKASLITSHRGVRSHRGLLRVMPTRTPGQGDTWKVSPM